jgi:hypothetical protein
MIFSQTNVSGHCNGQHKQNIMTKKLNNIVYEKIIVVAGATGNLVVKL